MEFNKIMILNEVWECVNSILNGVLLSSDLLQ